MELPSMQNIVHHLDSNISENNKFYVEFFNLPAFLGISIRDVNGTKVQNLIYKTNSCIRGIFEIEKIQQYKKLKSFYITLSMCLHDIFNYKLHVDKRVYNFYQDIGIELQKLGSFTISNFCNISLHKRFNLGMFMYFMSENTSMRYFLGIGGELVMYLNFLNKKFSFLNPGFIFKYWYNYLTTDNINKKISFFYPWMYYTSDINTSNLFNSYSTIAGLSYYSIFTLKINLSELRNIYIL